MPGVADLLGRGGLVERVGGDGGDERAGRGVLRQRGQAGGRAFLATAGEGDAELVRAEVGDGDDALGAAAQGDGVLEGSLAGQVEHRVHAVGGERPDPFDQALAVEGRGGAERGEVVLVGGAGGGDDTRSAGRGELDREGGDRSRRAAHSYGLRR